VTSPEDRLRQVLLAEAEELLPTGDGLQRIQARLADRRSLRSKLLPAVAIAGVVAVAGAAAITVSLTDDGSLKQPQRPATGNTPSPSPSLSTSAVTTSASGTPVWPFTTDAQAADWGARPGARTWASDPVQVTQHLLADYLALPGQAMKHADDNADVALVDVSAGGRTVSQVRLVHVGRDPNGPWSVVSANAVSLAITQPSDGDEVSSPINIAGTAADPDTSVHLRLMADRMLGEGYAMAGRDIPWTHSLPWAGTGWTVAALVGNTFNGKGDLHAITITAVRRASSPGGPPSGSTFVAIDDTHRVVNVDAVTGKQLRQVSFPPAGTTDSDPDRGGGDVVWARTKPDGCSSALIRASAIGTAVSTPVAFAPVRRRLPALSEGGRSLAWVERPCGGGPSTVVVHGPDAKFSTTATSTAPIEQLDVRDDGWAVVQAGGRVVMMPPGTADVSRVPALTPKNGCVILAPAWDGARVLAWQGCPGNQWSLGHWSVRTGSATFGPVISGLPEPRHAAVAAGDVLVWLTDGRIIRLSGDQLVTIPNATRWDQPDW
jgi:hypothetical protein